MGSLKALKESRYGSIDDQGRGAGLPAIPAGSAAEMVTIETEATDRLANVAVNEGSLRALLLFFD